MLELDGGFAGGVCRCSSCGTLMTVPSDPTRERAETLSRPDTPGGGRPEAPTSTRPDAPGRPGTPTSAPAKTESPAPAEPAATADTEILVTPSGKKVRVSKKMTVPMAKRRRKAIRVGVIVVFALFTVFIVAGVIGAVVVMMQPPKPPGAVEPDGPQIVVESNPFLLKKPNFLGLPLSKRAVVTIDASSSSRSWLAVASEGFYSGTEPMTSDTSAQLIFWREGGFASYPSDQPKSMSTDAERKELRDFIEGISARGAADGLLALEKAFGAKPSQVIIMTGKALEEAELTKLKELMKANPGVKVDFAVIGEETPGLAELLKESGGNFVELSSSRLSSWYAESQDKAVATGGTTGGGTTTGN